MELLESLQSGGIGGLPLLTCERITLHLQGHYKIDRIYVKPEQKLGGNFPVAARPQIGFLTARQWFDPMRPVKPTT
jgi:hypothetical protein